MTSTQNGGSRVYHGEGAEGEGVAGRGSALLEDGIDPLL